MAVTSKKKYIGVSNDLLSKFNGNQIIYLSWDHHLLFAAPFLHCVQPKMLFSTFIYDLLIPLLAADPDGDKIDWEMVTWLKSNEPWVPDFSKNLEENEITHKVQLRFRTPELNTLCGLEVN